MLELAKEPEARGNILSKEQMEIQRKRSNPILGNFGDAEIEEEEVCASSKPQLLERNNSKWNSTEQKGQEENWCRGREGIFF